MKGRAFIDRVRTGTLASFEWAPQAYALLADGMEEADESYSRWIRTLGIARAEWWDARATHKEDVDILARALRYLDRRGLIERKPGEPHLIRFVEEHR